MRERRSNQAREGCGRGRSSSPYAAQVITKVPNWGILTAFDILLNNLAVGTFLAVMLWLAAGAGAVCAASCRRRCSLALVLLGADLLLLVVDLGDTWRFHHMLRVFKPRAPMSLGTWSLTLVWDAAGACRTGRLCCGWLGAPAWLDWIGNAAAWLAVIPAVGSILYKGVLFSVTSQPGWQDARWLGGYISNSAILLGCSILLALAAVTRPRRGGSDAARRAARPAPARHRVVYSSLSRHCRRTFKQRYGANGRMFFWLGVVALGWIVPFLLLVQGEIVELLPAVFFLVGALAVRIWFVLLPRSANAWPPAWPSG